ncbi:ethanolamine utilization protein EutL [Bifidobacterium dentium]|uniref:ethanolamine utilization protein EutL n=1 Tax=Bifidobacterium dentium TaxID=1689 RepID=UPI0018C224D8|nr:ethanolamine utilization protein EutL [Bifidobacterium dentium]MBF9695394.1 ethanolamine utilization protein EutL [Bifidobacterium dentium]MBF9711555.1 ethanolamine utilization protein EutL [Bifidobacterium dentium]MBF9713515.1 ethanolamine utilization protein EutL [Bifidobacterium dentium]MBF9717485.1 ethanolamine utilization protein EutL [Bifidobacterium dentium]
MTNFDFDTRNTQNQQQNTDGQPTQTMPEQQGAQASQPAQQYYAPPTQPAQPVPDSFNGPVAAKSNTKLGGKVIGVVAGISLLCGLVGGVGGAFAVNALSGSNEPQMSQQGGPSQGGPGQMGGQSGNGNSQNGNGQMGEPPSGQGGQSGSDGQSDSNGNSGSQSDGSSSGKSSGSNSSSSYSDADDSDTIAS